jgi:protein O-mannosyl-transferase
LIAAGTKCLRIPFSTGRFSERSREQRAKPSMAKQSRTISPRTLIPTASEPVVINDAATRWGCIAAIATAVFLAWSNTFSGPFVLDDLSSIVTNASIRDFWSLQWLTPPATAGETVSGRPVLNFTFAVNYAIHGLEIRGYHAFNVLVHVVSAIVLFALVRFTVLTINERAGGNSAPVGLRAANGIAFSVALIWGVHPLQTAAVTYVVQRAESLAGLFYLLTLYAFARYAGPTVSRARWGAACVATCLLGMGSKETVATAPLIVLLYDRAFLAGSFRAAWTARWRVHASLMATWLVLGALVVANRGRGGSAGLGTTVDPWAYFLTQGQAIVNYLRLAFWPHNQVFDYGTNVVEKAGAVLPQLLLLSALAAFASWALWRNRPAGFVGACFFLTLAPSSSFIPIATQVAAEHRMYLALAAVIVAVVSGIASRIKKPAARRGTAVLVLITATALGATTFDRNRVYHSSLALWQDTVNKRPTNARARNNLGVALVEAGRIADAEKEFLAAIALQPNHAFAHFSWGTILLSQRRWEEAATRFRDALAADPNYVDAHVNLGRAFTELGRSDEAIAEYRTALQLDPQAHDARTNLAALLIKQGQFEAGEAMLREVLSASPDLAEAHYHLALARERSGAIAEAETELREAIRLKPKLATAHVALGNSLARRGETAAAEGHYREAIQDDPKLAEAHFALGNVLAKRERLKDAMSAYREALALDPVHVQARNNLANAQLMSGLLVEAIASYEASLQLRPADAAVRQNLEIARELLRRKSAGGR